MLATVAVPAPMDHCHNLTHASEGLVAHLMYTGVTQPFRVGGDAGNDPG